MRTCFRYPPGRPSVRWGAPYTDGLVALYTMSETGGLVVADATGKCANGELKNGATLGLGTLGPRAVLASSGSRYISVPHTAASPLNITGDITVMVAFRYVAQNVRNPLATKMDNGSFGYYLDITSTPSLRMMCNVTSVANPGAVANINPALNTVHVAAGTVQGTTARCYLNGVQQASGSVEPVPSIAQPFAIGARPAYDSVCIDATVYWVAVWNKAYPQAVAALRDLNSVLDLLVSPAQWLYTGMGSGEYTPIEVMG